MINVNLTKDRYIEIAKAIKRAREVLYEGFKIIQIVKEVRRDY